jgi:hypothetical protein
MEAAMLNDLPIPHISTPTAKYPVDQQGFITSLQGVEVGELFWHVDTRAAQEGPCVCYETTSEYCRIAGNIFRIADASLIANPRQPTWTRTRLRPPTSEQSVSFAGKLKPTTMPCIEATLADISQKLASDAEVDAMTANQLAAEIDRRLKAIDADESSSNDMGLDQPKAFYTARKIQIQRRHYDNFDIFVFGDKSDAATYVNWLRDGHTGLPNNAGIVDHRKEDDGEE